MKVTNAMIKLLIIADDLTGALDTGVQFAKNHIPTSITLERNIDTEKLDQADVLVIDSETRHNSSQEAFEVIYQLASWAKKQGIPMIYKKVDSVFRGNIGSELAALIAACGESICFAPAFPRNGRITVNGTQFLDDRPIHETVFGEDPFEPVLKSYIPDIIAMQSDIDVACYKVGEKPDKAMKTRVDVFDAVSDEDLKQIAVFVKDQYRLYAGCAGFAEYLNGMISFEADRTEIPPIGHKFLVVSGSLNNITIQQIQNVQSRADLYSSFSDRQLFDTDYLLSYEGQLFLQNIKGKDFAVLFSEKNNAAGEYEKKILPEKKRETVSHNLGRIAAAAIQNADKNTILVVFGGDTLYGTMKALNCSIRPLFEIMPGVVLGQLNTASGLRYIITKSGGFGKPELLENIYDLVNTNQLGV